MDEVGRIERNVVFWGKDGGIFKKGREWVKDHRESIGKGEPLRRKVEDDSRQTERKIVWEGKKDDTVENQ
jgi:hypothetical protein